MRSDQRALRSKVENENDGKSVVGRLSHDLSSFPEIPSFSFVRVSHSLVTSLFFSILRIYFQSFLISVRRNTQLGILTFSDQYGSRYLLRDMTQRFFSSDRDSHRMGILVSFSSLSLSLSLFSGQVSRRHLDLVNASCFLSPARLNEPWRSVFS